MVFLTSFFCLVSGGIEFEARDNEDPWWGGKEFTKQELLEISAVTVPANPNATVSIHGMSDDNQKKSFTVRL